MNPSANIAPGLAQQIQRLTTARVARSSWTVARRRLRWWHDADAIEEGQPGATCASRSSVELGGRAQAARRHASRLRVLRICARSRVQGWRGRWRKRAEGGD